MSSQVRLECEKRWRDCRECDLHRDRNNVVIGYGDINAQLMFIGEAPGENEDIQGIPFIGESGELLDLFLDHFGFGRDEVFVDNAVACRPPGNREPSKGELEACKPRIIEAIYKVDPLIIVALGGTAFKALTTSSEGITKARNSIHETVINREHFIAVKDLAQLELPPRDVKYPVVPTYHPAFLKREEPNRHKTNSAWKQFFEDIGLAIAIYDKLRKKYYNIEEPERDFKDE